MTANTMGLDEDARARIAGNLRAMADQLDPPREQGRVQVNIPKPHLAHLLGLPRDIRVVDVEVRTLPWTMRVVLESPQFEPVPDGAVPPVVSIQEHRNSSGDQDWTVERWMMVPVGPGKGHRQVDLRAGS